jgi:hypothetical protein
MAAAAAERPPPLARRGDLVANIWPGFGTEVLSAPVRHEENPSTAGKERAERAARGGVVASAAVVVENGREWAAGGRLVDHSVEDEVPVRERHGLLCAE